MGVDTLRVRFADDERGQIIQFRPRARDAIEVIDYAMNDDTAPCEVNPDPFMSDQPRAS